MKKLALTIYSVLFFIIATTPTLAQEEELPTEIAPIEVQSGETVLDSGYFTVEMIFGTQSPWDKSVPVTVKIRPQGTATRVGVTWDLPLGLEVKDSSAGKYVAIGAGEVYSYTAKIKPLQSGTYTISATATDWDYGANYATTASKNVTFTESLLTDPLTTNYSVAVMIRYAIMALILVVIGGIGIIYGKKGLKALQEWLKPPEL